MSVNLRDRLFNDTGGVIQGATVQAILVTGGGTDAGTGSTVQSTTTTDVNGVWKFAALPDPGAGNWYDVKIINGNQVRWRYGNIQSLLNTLLINSTFTVPATNKWDFSAAEIVLPTGTTAPTNPAPVAGIPFYNTTLGQLQIYNGSAWSPIIGDTVANQVFSRR